MTKKKLIYNFRRGDYGGCQQDLLSVDWESLFYNLNINDMVQTFYTTLWEIIDKHVPKKKQINNQYPTWFSLPLIKLLKEKNKVRLRAKKYNCPLDHLEFSMLRKRAKKLQRDCYRSYINSVEQGLQNDVKAFWSYTKSLRTTNSIPKEMNLDNETANSGEQIANLFSKYFTSVYTNSDNTKRSSISNISEYYQFNIGRIHLSLESIKLYLEKIDTSKGAGPDKIPPIFIQRCADVLSSPLSYIYNRSLSQATFPELWKIAHIIPIFKSGDQSSIKNYRPISILSCFAKVFESLIYKYIFSHFRPQICDRQHGFVPKKSINSNLLEFYTYICDAFDERTQVDAIYTDFQKAFDKVNHIILIKKLLQIGIHGDLLRWLESYLSNRTQLVIINGYQSSPSYVSSGVPQGSNLGPLLFLIFINDLSSVLHCNFVLFADDLKLYHKILSDDDHKVLQKDLDELSKWCEINDMFLNIDKCFSISFTRNRNRREHVYKLDNVPLKEVTSIRDLGITLDSKLIFDVHINNMKSKSLKMLGFVYRMSKPFKNPQSSITIYNSLIRSRLEYGAVIWNPHYDIYINTIESIQKKFLKTLSYKFGLTTSLQSYEDRLEHFNLGTLKMRRKLIDLTCLYKILHNHLDTVMCLNRISFRIPNKRNLRHRQTFFVDFSHNNISFFNPVSRMCRLFNSIERDGVDVWANSLSHFKRQMSRVSLL